ncbi:MAG: thiaminase II [Bacillus sp. (in: firmicutes)]
MSFCAEVRMETDLYWKGSFEHPFVKGIADGSLPLEKFRMYIMQDAFYLKHYTKVLAIAASKAERSEDIQYFLGMSKFIHEAELDIHRSVFKELGVTEQEIMRFEPAPAAYNYVTHMYHAAVTGDVGEAFAAMLPCPWLYQEIGMRIKGASPGVKQYEDWIKMYSSDEMKENIAVQIGMMNRFAEEQPEKRPIFSAHFRKSCYYEWKFWEMAWSSETWEGEVNQYEFA